jgi:hypothetical protein
MIYRRFLAIAGLLLAPIGCQDDQAATNPVQSGSPPTTDTVPQEEVASLVWVQSEIQEGDFVLALGHRGDDFKSGNTIEPAVTIMMGDVEVTSAVVHNSLLTADGETVLAEEQQSAFAPRTDDEPGHYAKGALMIPEEVKKLLIRFRIKLPDVKTESIYDIEREITE